jgi:AraC-like DNA-binding protein/mannose-6-phosphate isomerase-like protein (cupin superfamily)
MTARDVAHLRNRLEWIEAEEGAVIAVAGDYPDGHKVGHHRHRRAQLLHALSGVVMVSTDQGRWMVPPDHAMWIPAGTVHSVEMLGFVRMRSAYVMPGVSDGLPQNLNVLAMSDLMRSLVNEAVEIGNPAEDDQRGAAIMQLILHELPRLEERPFGLPFPTDQRLAKLCRQFVANPSPHATIDEWAREAGMSRRSFTRAFLAETGLSLSLWRQQATLFAALPRLAEGVPVTTLALDLGYDSAPAFTTMFRRMLGASPRDYLRREAETSRKG